MNWRFGAAPTVLVVIAAWGGMIKSSQNGPINEGGTVPALPLGLKTVVEGNGAFCHSDIESGSRLRNPSVDIEI